MVLDAVRGYVQLASGLTDVTRQRAQQVARQLLEQGGGVVDAAMSTSKATSKATSKVPETIARQVQALTEELMATGRANRDLLVGLVRTEVERAVARLGLVDAEDLASMTRLVQRLQNQLDAAIAFGGAPMRRATGRRGAPSPSGSDEPSAAIARRAPSNQAAAKKAAADRAAEKAAGTKTTARKTTAKKTTAKKTTAKKTAAKKSTPRKVPVKTVPAETAPAPDTAGLPGGLAPAAEQVPPPDVPAAPSMSPTSDGPGQGGSDLGVQGGAP
jgi:hypothetical protein